MNRSRLEKSLALLREVNRERRATGAARGAKAAYLASLEGALVQHDDDARARVDARQMTIWEAIHPP